MRQGTSSTALTTSHHPNITFGRSRRRVTTFTPASPASTDPARDLAAAVYAWGRIATPVAEPDTCPVAWCVNCETGSVDTLDEDALYHHSATATVEAISHNGGSDAEQLTIEVTVERLEFTADANVAQNEPATAVLRLGITDDMELSGAKATEISAALNKARVSARGLAARDNVRNGETGAVTVVRTGSGTLHVGAIFTTDGPVIYINMLTTLTAGDVREIARGERVSFPPDSWDLTPAAAGQLAAAVDAAAALAAADRAVTA